MSEHRSMPWANGGGTTLEIATFPAPDAWTWRLSIATVAADGPFSVLPGVERHIVVAEGAGMVLRVDGVEHRLAKYETLTFSGSVPAGCALIDGPVRDLNLMVREGFAGPTLRVERLARGTTIAAKDVFAIVVLDGAVAVSTPSPGFPGTPVRERAGRFDALLGAERSAQQETSTTDEHAHTYARLGSVVTAAADSVLAFVVATHDAAP